MHLTVNSPEYLRKRDAAISTVATRKGYHFPKRVFIWVNGVDLDAEPPRITLC